MGKQRVLSSKFNMSLGYIPVIISIILCDFVTSRTAIHIGTGAGLLASIYMLQRKGSHIPQIILYCMTGMLLLLTAASFFSTAYCPETMLPFTLEISAIIPTLILFLNRNRLSSCRAVRFYKCNRQTFAQGAEATVVSARVLLLIGFLHLFIIAIALLSSYPFSDTMKYVLFHIMPLCVFVLSILFNQFGIYYFNKVMRYTVFIPIVTKRGDVIGKAIASEAISRKSEYIHPVVRIAVASHGMLFLLPRSQHCILEKGRTDLLMEGYLLYGETLEQGVKRVLQHTLPTAPLQNLHFNIKYHFENETTNRLIYLFTLDLDDDSILDNKDFKDGKLWTFQQIEQNLHHNFFSSCFEHEFEHIYSLSDY